MHGIVTRSSTPLVSFIRGVGVEGTKQLTVGRVYARPNIDRERDLYGYLSPDLDVTFARLTLVVCHQRRKLP